MASARLDCSHGCPNSEKHRPKMDRRTCHSDVGSFLRIHRSYIVNLERVVRIDPYGKDGRLAILCDGAGRFGAPAVPV